MPKTTPNVNVTPWRRLPAAAAQRRYDAMTKGEKR